MDFEKEKKYPPGTTFEIDDKGRRIVILPSVARRSLGIDSRSVGRWTSRDQNRAPKKT